MADQKCTFQMRTPINNAMLNEIVAREIKHYRQYKHYRPNFNYRPVICKPYSSHDIIPAKTEEEDNKFKHYLKKVTEMRSLGNCEKYPAAATENLCYGWFHKPVIGLDRSDRRFFKPINECNITKTEIEIRKHKHNDNDKDKY